MTPTTDLRFGVSAATVEALPLDKAARACRQAGVAAMGFHSDRLLDDAAASRRALQGLTVTGCAPATFSILPLSHRPGPADPGERVAAIVAGIRALAPFEPTCCVVNTGDTDGVYSDSAAWEIAVNGYAQVTQAAVELGVTVAIEPYHPRYRKGRSLIWTLPQAMRMIDDVGADNLGIMLDVWHLWDSPGLLDQIPQCSGRIVGVQLDDWRDPTRTWCDRVLPGDGLADIPAILCALEQSGYRGWYDLEIVSDDGRYGSDFPDSLWKLDPVELIRRGRAQAERVWDLRLVPGHPRHDPRHGGTA